MVVFLSSDEIVGFALYSVRARLLKEGVLASNPSSSEAVSVIGNWVFVLLLLSPLTWVCSVSLGPDALAMPDDVVIPAMIYRHVISLLPVPLGAAVLFSGCSKNKMKKKWPNILVGRVRNPHPNFVDPRG